jgi:hypothetical protein
VPITISSSRHIDSLLRDLRSDRAATRDAAVARLMVIGVRAVERLIALGSDRSAAPSARTAALRALEGIGESRALDSATRLLEDPGQDPDIAVAAAAVVRRFLHEANGLTALDVLTAVALDRGRADRVRVAALRALGDLEPATISALVEKLLVDPSAAVRAAATGPADITRTGPRGRGSAKRPRPSASRSGDSSTDLSRLPDDPELARRAIIDYGGAATLTALHHVIEQVREQERLAGARQRRGWIAVRAAAHVALATRSSRLAVYDLRESLTAAKEPLPVEFLAALTLVGDATCLEPLAAAYARGVAGRGAKAEGDWWLRHLADAFHSIATRQRMTRRHAEMKRIAQRWPEAAKALGPAPGAARVSKASGTLYP